MTFVHFSSGNVVVVVSASGLFVISVSSSVWCLLCFDENDVSIGKILSFQDKKGKVLIATNLLSIPTYR